MAASTLTSGEKAVIKYEELLDFSIKCLISAGSDPINAAQVAEVCVAADVRGITSHGVNRLELYCSELSHNAVRGTGTPIVVAEGPAFATVDGNNLQGAVVGKFCMQLAMKKAKESGVGWVVARNSNHYGIAGYYTLMAQKEGLLGMSMTNTSPVAVPTRAAAVALGTNPIALSTPAGAGGFTIDMATTTVPLGRVEVYHRKEQELPTSDWGVDKDGQPTTDPNKILFGGGVSYLGGASSHKGFCMAILVETLTALLSGASAGPSVPMALNPNAMDRTQSADLGQCYIALDPEKFCPGFDARSGVFSQQMRDLPRAGADPVLMPGDPEDVRTAEQMEKGIELPLRVATALVNLGEVFNVPVPEALKTAQ